MSRTLDQLARLRAQQLQVENDIRREVWDARARMHPVPWSQIADALGVTKQTVHRKYAYLDDVVWPEDVDAYDSLIA